MPCFPWSLHLLVVAWCVVASVRCTGQPHHDTSIDGQSQVSHAVVVTGIDEAPRFSADTKRIVSEHNSCRISVFSALACRSSKLTTPVGRGIRSLNVALCQIFDLYSCVVPAIISACRVHTSDRRISM